MNRVQKLLIVILGITAFSVIAITTIFASLIGFLIAPLLGGPRNVPKKDDFPQKLKNSIDAEFHRIKASEQNPIEPE